ncbi:hypothetical protein N658DRAFT_517061 [Parathielavia hyrcaniae]|uniref:BHLH domain-containing protein n=1 Tax=Parathielavia hyrcaniae TaxID=113614 RepID=A0AAN6SZP6_9PEZI|nr:hypothetical protein N658DRAFT_517061 [Parathielavia hyrcaniae]
MAQHGFSMSGHGAIDPNDLAMAGNYPTSFQHGFNPASSTNTFSSGSALFGDDELRDGLNGPIDTGMQDFDNNMGDMNISYSHGVYGSHPHGLPMDQRALNGYSSTPDGDPIQSPFASNFARYQPIQHAHSLGGLKSPLSYAGSPLAASDMNDNGPDPNFLNAQAQARAHLAGSMQRKQSSTRGSLTPKTAAMAGLSVPAESGFGAQPIRATGGHHEKSHSGQWIQTPNSMSSFPGSGFSSPLQAGLQSNQINDMILKGGVSMPAKLGTPTTAATSQEARRKRRRESHNLVERRRRDNINERIQDLSKLVPLHRLDDEKVKKAIQNGTPLSPTLSGIGAPSQATSALAGPGARRAAGGSTGNITTGLPVEDKDKGPNKGDILNGAVSWTRDLMWMLKVKLQQQEELVNALYERGGQLPFEITDDERRMQSELLDAINRIDEATGQAKSFSYSRTAGSGLRVPHHTDYKGEPLNGNGNGMDHGSLSPDADEYGMDED